MRTRIPVWTLVAARQSGLTDVQILRACPTLRPQDRANAMDYAEAHHTEIARDIAENEKA